MVQEATKHRNIYAALSAFQGELKPMEKTGHVKFAQKNDPNKFVDFRYTPLGEIMTVIYPLLAKHGLSVRHEVTKEGVEAILTHETYSKKFLVKHRGIGGGEVEAGEIIEADSVLEMTPQIENELRSGIVKITYGSDMKDTGAALTYVRRYTLTMLLGISSEDDKDAELLEQSAKNAVQTVYERFKAGIKKAATPAEVGKQMDVLNKDLVTLEKGKAPALGLKREQYEELIKNGEARIEELNTNQDPQGE